MPEPPCGRKRLQDAEIIWLLDEFLYRGEVHEFKMAQQSFQRNAASLGAEDMDAIIPPCLEVLEFANRYIRNDTLLCLLHVSMGCMGPEARLEDLGPAMRRNAAVLARHEALPMLVRALDYLLGQDLQDAEDGMFEREFRLVLNCIYLQVLFNENDEHFVSAIEKGCGRMGASLATLLFEAALSCSDSDKILPVKKIMLLLLRVLQRLLDIPDKVLYPLPEEGGKRAQRPKVMDLQSFTALHMHQTLIRSKYSGRGSPAAVDEGLWLAEQYEDEFLATYPFHPTELDFMKQSPQLRDAYLRYQELRSATGISTGSRLLPRGARPKQGALGAMVPSQAGARSQDIASGSESAASSSSRAGSLSARSQESAATEVQLGDMEVEPLAQEWRETERASPSLRSAGTARATRVAEPDLLDESPVSTWRRLYVMIAPRLTELVVFLLRLLLTSCSNVDSSGVDFSLERRAGDMQDDKECPESVEAQRHKEILAASVAGVLLVLLKSAKRSAAEEFAFVAQLIADSNGALVVLKYLNQDTNQEQAIPPVLPCLRAGKLSTREGLMSSYWQACGTLRLVEVLYLVCRDCPERVRKYLINYRAHFILKRLNRVESPRAERLVLKLLKKQVRYLPRKWKQANMKVVSAIYLQVPMSPLEDWLLNEALGEQTMEGPPAKETSEEHPEATQLAPVSTPAALGYVHAFPEYVPRR
ncbi:unnamed protein product [Effrenium voratum]|nr:unnamed protein product [Effrenium voratum]